ncbi:multicomponent Na+:H+ antiporter subunit E [Desulfonatronum thiosulfatophilum]|uniref:Multicomponent Na+:H+ antiporter subunit E n=1 Tax=Desulfonatronum thiosulfatophilum TaxID=617002 RepID=A0A1G6DKH1_9BACT|nr:Na+/H+ antiporter subunit E [Desulfonatronum thiosulfatophilum]SDB45674.1 multicomponent Na+:H+ antiporter subunit E [Desulfonatronum thiosulfatophilum]
MIAFFKRFVLFLILWVILNEGIFRYPLLAGAGIGAATIFSFHLWPERLIHLNWRFLPGLVFYFIRSSLKGGLDIAYRAVSPSMPLQPDLIRIESRLENEAGVVLLAWMISLMPGTASINLERRVHLTIHVVDSRMYGEEDLRILEGRIARLVAPGK